VFPKKKPSRGHNSGVSTIYLIRHADAGDPWEFPKDDSKRALSRFGKEQAKDMAAQIRGFGIREIFTSPAQRCEDTVQYFRRSFNAKVEQTPILSPNRPNVITPFMRTLPSEPVLVCTHSDNIYAFLKQIHEEDRVEIPKMIAIPCGSFYVVEREGTIFTSVKYVPPNTAPPAPTKDEEEDVWVE
jgi:phosphohistidine phosphatase SixA